MDIKTYVDNLTKSAKSASQKLAYASHATKDAALIKAADALVAATAQLKAENEKDIESAAAESQSSAFIDRLRLTDSRIRAMADGLRQVALLKDPVGEVMESTVRPNGIRLQKVRVPIGVILIIYESRPNVTADAAALCLKAGNAVILRGGKESLRSNIAIHRILADSLQAVGLDPACVQLVETPDRTALDYLLQADNYINLVIPRGGEGLIRAVAEKSRIPVIKHYRGVCHTYVDKDANLEMAVEVCHNAKVQRPGTCNAMEAMLVHEAIAARFLPEMAEELRAAGAEIRGCPRTRQILPDAKPAAEDDWGHEYLDLILAVKVVASLDEAIDHITRYGSAHSDAIITENLSAARQFVQQVDSAAVFVNASTRLHDGGEFGMGAEIGISTDKIHARGPMALPELTSYKWVIYGNGQVRG